ncbi:MAG TPA: DUF2339 domain-containing protein [Chthoniobacterales bacterium]|jgi:uncharacterized membrane protein
MGALIVFGLIFIVVCFLLPILAMARSAAARDSVADLGKKIGDLQAQLNSLRQQVGQTAGAETTGTNEATAAVSRRKVVMPIIGEPPMPQVVMPIIGEPPMPQVVTPIIGEPPMPQVVTPQVAQPPQPVPSMPPPLPDLELAKMHVAPKNETPATIPPAAPVVSAPKIDWERFMGAKMFAWLGGLALFLGVAFFVKYSFEHNLVPPEVRVAIGFVIGVGLLLGGVGLKRKENAITAQTLCATGILILYAVTFASRAYYHFAFFGLIPTFLLMTLITATAFVAAIRLNGMTIAILGLAGGFLTPILLSTGQDNPAALFGYIALLDVGLLLVALRMNWQPLPVLGAVGTVLMQLAWISQFFVRNHYFGNWIWIPMTVFLGFQVLFLIGLRFSKQESKSDQFFCGAAIGMGVVTLLSTFFFLAFPTIAHRPLLLFGYAFLADIGLIAVALLREKQTSLSAAAGGLVILILAAWMMNHLTEANLFVLLGFTFVFAVLHSCIPLLLHKLRGTGVSQSSHAFPAVALLLMLFPMLSLPHVSMLVWPLVLCIDLLAIVVAVVTATLLPVAVILVLTLAVIGSSILRIGGVVIGFPPFLFVLSGFTIFFVIASTWVSRRLLGGSGAKGGSLLGNFNQPANAAVQLPMLSAALPFLLLLMMTLRLPMPSPTPVFGVALLLVILLLGMTKLLKIESLSAIALVAVLALEYSWHAQNFKPTTAMTPFIWYLSFAAIFTIFPFVFHRQFARSTIVWATSALAAPLHFFLIYRLIRLAWPTSVPGLIPALFALPAIGGLLFLLRRTPSGDNPARNSQLALFGGAALFFITLIFPIQFDRQWITLGWALEGAALCWLFGRIPHPGLRLTGIALLVIAFARLALNPAVLSYHPHAATPIFNWYFYTYGITAAALFLAGNLLNPPRHRIAEINVQAMLYSLGTILAFLLLNIEIADFFSKPGAAELTFQFSGNFARDMSYSIAWSGFALLLLVIGIAKSIRAVRYASMGLLGVTILKLFLHDLSQLEQLYRIAAFIIVAVVAMIASFLYQRFFGIAEKQAQ